jgi:hypothetical protein
MYRILDATLRDNEPRIKKKEKKAKRLTDG